jgi:K+-sensing histidine kinase KdpD
VPELAPAAGAGLVEITVCDQGIGIPPAQLPRIFDPYFTTKESGTGIGLYMSRLIIEDHMKGQLSARNGPEGAEFTISCPVAANASVTATSDLETALAETRADLAAGRFTEDSPEQHIAQLKSTS